MRKLLFLLPLLFATTVCAQTMTATVSFTDPNTGPQAVDGVQIDRSTDGGATWVTATTLKPGDTTFSENVSWTPTLCYQGIPFNSAGKGPAASSCQAGVKVPPGSLQNFTLVVK